MGVVPTVLIRAIDIDAITEARFWQQVRIDFRPSACWEWLSSNVTGDGYGRFKIAGRKISANRVSYALFNRETPRGMFVCHRCDNPSCVRPDHLFLGTPTENMADRDRKGRGIKGSLVASSLLNETQVSEIKRLLSAGDLTARQIGERYGVRKTTVLKIKGEKNWRHVSA